MKGSIRLKGPDRWQIRVCLGRDPEHENVARGGGVVLIHDGDHRADVWRRRGQTSDTRSALIGGPDTEGRPNWILHSRRYPRLPMSRRLLLRCHS